MYKIFVVQYKYIIQCPTFLFKMYNTRLQEKPISPPCRDGMTPMGDVLFTRVAVHCDLYRDKLFRPGEHDC